MTSWRAVLPIHPAADLFPLMTAEERAVLADDIAKNGLRSPIVLWESAKGETAAVLDGRNRLDAIEARNDGPIVGDDGRLYFDPKFLRIEYVRGDQGVDPFAYVISANIHRRHLSTEQRIDLVAKVLKLDPKMSARRAAKLAGVSPTTATKARTKLEQQGDVSTAGHIIDSKGRRQPARKAKPKAAPTLQQRTATAIKTARAKDKRTYGTIDDTRVIADVVSGASREQMALIFNDTGFGPEWKRAAQARIDRIPKAWDTITTTNTDKTPEPEIVTAPQIEAQRQAEFEADEIATFEHDIDPENYENAFLLRVDTAESLAFYNKEIAKPATRQEFVTLAERVAQRWRAIADKLRGAPEPPAAAPVPSMTPQITKVLDALLAEGAKDMATMSPGTVSDLTTKLTRLLLAPTVSPSVRPELRPFYERVVAVRNEADLMATWKGAFPDRRRLGKALTDIRHGAAELIEIEAEAAKADAEAPP